MTKKKTTKKTKTKKRQREEITERGEHSSDRLASKHKQTNTVREI